MSAYTRLRDGQVRRARDGATIQPAADTLDAREYRAAVAADPSCVADEPAPGPALTTDPEAVCAAYAAAEMANLTPAGAVQLAQWAQAQVPKALACAAWVQALYAERDAKLAAIDRGEAVDPTPSSPWKPYSFREIAASL